MFATFCMVWKSLSEVTISSAPFATAIPDIRTSSALIGFPILSRDPIIFEASSVAAASSARNRLSLERALTAFSLLKSLL